MSLAPDHLVVAARTLEEGAQWLETRCGVPTVPGGRHARMGTHNRLLSLGPGLYLEIIAIDPKAPPPGRPRWFALDSPAMAERLARGPALVHWVARTDDLDGARAAHPREVGEILAMARGDFRWRIGVAADGALPAGGAFPTLIQWDGDAHPASAAPDSGCRLEALNVRCPEAQAVRARLATLGLDPQGPVHFAASDAVGLSAFLRTPGGIVILPEASRPVAE